MVKKFILSLALVLLVVAAVAAGATYMFRGSYESLQLLQSQTAAQEEAEQETLQLPAVINTPAPEEENTGFGAEDEEFASDAPTTTVQPEDFANTLRAKAIVDGMSLEEKICQMLFITPEALTGYNRVTQSGSVTRSALQRYHVGGVIYFSTNLVTMSQTADMLETIQQYAKEDIGIGLFLGVDEEGGSVARVGPALGTTTFEDMSYYGQLGDTGEVYGMGKTMAEDLTSLGFNLNFAPVADVVSNENTVVKDRSFGSDPDLVSEMVRQEVKGMMDYGLLCAPKHFPGHGSTGEDTHDGFAASERTLEELHECDLKPFQAAIDAGAPMILVGHMTMTAIDPDHPASMSNMVVTGILRDQLGYDGIVITDALNMSAIINEYTYSEAAIAAIKAGCDMLLCVSNVSSVVTAVADAVEAGEIAEETIDNSVTRIISQKLKYGLAS